MISTIETDRLRLTPLNLDCFEMYKSFYCNEIASIMYGGPLSEAEVWMRLKADLGSWYLLGFGVWAIQLKSTDEYVGTCGFWQGKSWPKELTWWVLPEKRGDGIATEASLAAIQFAYDEFGWSRVETYMNDENSIARRLVEKLGGKKVDRFQFPDGLQRDLFLIPRPS